MKSHPIRLASTRVTRNRASIRHWPLIALLVLSAVGLQVLSRELRGNEPAPLQGGLFYTVNTTSDAVVAGACANGNPGCSLRGAIQAANSHPGADGIGFDLPVASVINLTGTLPDLTEGVSISGPGVNKPTVRRNTGGNYRIFNVTTSGTVSISGMTISNGNLTGVVNGSGGGIQNATGTLNVSNCLVIGNSAQYGGGIGGSGSIFVADSSISGNFAVAGPSVAHEGGGIFFAGTFLSINHSTVSSNEANGSNGAGGGIFSNFRPVGIFNSAIVGNSGEAGGGIFNRGGTVTLSNSTLAGNSATGASGGGDGGGIYNNGTLSVSNSTITDNNALSEGGGIISIGTTNVKSSIIAFNTATTSGPDVSGSFTSQSFNLIGKNDGAAASFPAGNPNANTDIVGTSASPVNPMLDPNNLQFNDGGPTATIALLPGSPAIDKGISNSLTTDQRGTGFVRTVDNPSVANAVGGDGTDIGAFELGAHLGAVSRKMHGASPFDIDLPLVSPVGIECRIGGPSGVHQVVLSFPSAVTVTSAGVTSGTGGVSGFTNGSQVTVNVTGVLNAQTIVITLFGVSDGSNKNNITVPMGVLLGDTNANKAVNASDVSQTKSKSGQAVDTANFRTDVTVNGSINASDVGLVKATAGTALP